MAILDALSQYDMTRKDGRDPVLSAPTFRGLLESYGDKYVADELTSNDYNSPLLIFQACRHCERLSVTC